MTWADPFAEMDLEAMVLECERRKWRESFGPRRETVGWWARIHGTGADDADAPPALGDTIAEAIRAAMRKAAGR